MSNATLDLARLGYSLSNGARQRYEREKDLERSPDEGLADAYYEAQMGSVGQGIHLVGKSEPEAILEAINVVGGGVLWDILNHVAGVRNNNSNFLKAVVKFAHPDWSWEDVDTNLAEINTRWSGNYNVYLAEQREKQLKELLGKDFDFKVMLENVDSYLDMQALKGVIARGGGENQGAVFIPALAQVLDWVEADQGGSNVFDEELEVAVINDLGCSAVGGAFFSSAHVFRRYVQNGLSSAQEDITQFTPEQVDRNPILQIRNAFLGRAIPALEKCMERLGQLPEHPLLDEDPFQAVYFLFQVRESFKLEKIIGDLQGGRLEASDPTIEHGDGPLIIEP